MKEVSGFRLIRKSIRGDYFLDHNTEFEVSLKIIEPTHVHELNTYRKQYKFIVIALMNLCKNSGQKFVSLL